MFKFTPNQKKITDVVRMFKNGELIVDESYQSVLYGMTKTRFV